MCLFKQDTDICIDFCWLQLVEIVLFVYFKIGIIKKPFQIQQLFLYFISDI